MDTLMNLIKESADSDQVCRQICPQDPRPHLTGVPNSDSPDVIHCSPEEVQVVPGVWRHDIPLHTRISYLPVTPPPQNITSAPPCTYFRFTVQPGWWPDPSECVWNVGDGDCSFTLLLPGWVIRSSGHLWGPVSPLTAAGRLESQIVCPAPCSDTPAQPESIL